MSWILGILFEPRKSSRLGMIQSISKCFQLFQILEVCGLVVGVEPCCKLLKSQRKLNLW